MAQLGGLSSEAFSPPTGLGSILRDHKVLPGVRSNGANIGFGRVPVAQSGSVSSSPKDSFLLDGGTADESDDLNEEDIWGMEDTTDETGSVTDCEKRKMMTATEIGLGRPQKHRANARTELGISASKIEKLMPAQRKEKAYAASDVYSNGAPTKSSIFGRNSESKSLISRVRIPRRPSASRIIPISGVGDEDSSQRHAEGQSAPVQVPKWSKMMAGHNDKIGLIDSAGKGTKDDDDDPLPPHELLARENARSQRTTFSVCEGLGRTLKGRDLSRVRNAVWSQMGFAD